MCLSSASPAAQRSPSSSCNGPETTVNLRIEGVTETIYEGPILTCGHCVCTDSGGKHHCDGTNGGKSSEPGPTCTSALDDASKASGFTWDGTYDDGFDDFFITRIKDDAQTETQYWGILLNGHLIDVGGCQQQVKLNDHVLFAFDAFSKEHALKLEGPSTAKVGEAVNFRVTDECSGLPVGRAMVKGQTSGANGNVSVTFTSPGREHIKAERSDSIRSNALTIDVQENVS